MSKADELETSNSPDEALVSWFREAVAFTHSYSGVCALMASAHADPDSALYASSTALLSAGARLLLRAQAEGTARADMDGVDLFALMSERSAGSSANPDSRHGGIISFTLLRAPS